MWVSRVMSRNLFLKPGSQLPDPLWRLLSLERLHPEGNLRFLALPISSAGCLGSLFRQGAPIALRQTPLSTQVPLLSLWCYDRQGAKREPGFPEGLQHPSSVPGMQFRALHCGTSALPTFSSIEGRGYRRRDESPGLWDLSPILHSSQNWRC